MQIELESGKTVVLDSTIVDFLKNNKLDSCGPVVEQYYNLLADFAEKHNVCSEELEEAIHCIGLY